MRLFSLVLAVAALAGCAGGPEANQAYDLLQRAQVAQAKVSSVSYEAKTSFSVQGQSFGYAFTGAALLKGASAGDQWIELTSEDIPGVGPIEMTMVRRGSRMTIRSMGQTHEVPVPAELQAKQEAWGSFDSLDLTSCVEKVDVAEGRSLNGEPATRIAGEFDALCAFKAVSGVSGLGQNAGTMPNLEQLRDHLGDARATLFVSDRTHLVVGGLITLEIEVDGNKLSFDVSYRLTSINRPVRFPA
jgi:hypothetical protein